MKYDRQTLETMKKQMNHFDEETSECFFQTKHCEFGVFYVRITATVHEIELYEQKIALICYFWIYGWMMRKYPDSSAYIVRLCEKTKKKKRKKALHTFYQSPMKWSKCKHIKM